MHVPDSCHLNMVQLDQPVEVIMLQVQHRQSSLCFAIPPRLAHTGACQQILGVVKGVEDSDQQLLWKGCPARRPSLQHAVADGVEPKKQLSCQGMSKTPTCMANQSCFSSL